MTTYARSKRRSRPKAPRQSRAGRHSILTSPWPATSASCARLRRWIRSGRLRERRVGRRHAISDQDLRTVEDELYPMAELPDVWKVGDDGSPAPNWVADGVA